jgi:hypothetical protein
MQKAMKLPTSFTAVDSRGNSHTPNVFAEMRTTVDHIGNISTSTGPQSIRTQNGLNVGRLKKGTYKVAATGLLLRSLDPDAP